MEVAVNIEIETNVHKHYLGKADKVFAKRGFDGSLWGIVQGNIEGRFLSLVIQDDVIEQLYQCIATEEQP